jgi:polyferredoxin
MGTDANAYKLQRRRESLKRQRQLWVAGLILWAVVFGWVVWGFINSLDDNSNVRFAWLMAWVLPVVILATGSLITQRRLVACHEELVRNERHGQQHP